MLIITADDFGFSPTRNEAILSAAVRGRISAASLMVNMPYAEDACEQTKRNVPKLGLGLHFTLTSGSSLAPPEQVPLLVDSFGMFRLGFRSLQNLLRGRKKEDLLAQIRIEFEAQLAKMSEWGTQYSLRIDHLDSHQHIHAIPAIREILATAASESNQTLRIPRESQQGGLLRSPIGVLKRMVLDSCLRDVEQEVGYFGVLDSGRMGPAAWKRILNVVKENPELHFEANVHPGLADKKEADEEAVLSSKADFAFHRSPWRRREFETLLEPAFREQLNVLGLFPLGTFHELNKRRSASPQ